MIIVEDGSNVTGANSYVTEAELTAYAVARGITLATNTEQLLIKSMDYLESLQFNGSKAEETQPLQWPRTGVYIDGYYVTESTIPDLLKNSLNAICLEIEAGVNPLSTIDRETSSETVGPVSVTYKNGSSASSISRSITAQLRKLLSNSGGFALIR